MKKFFSLFTLSLLFFTTGKAQYVTIPDPEFVRFLSTYYPSCMSGSQLDTTCSAVVNEDTLRPPAGFDFYYIENYEGLQYFKNLVYLTIPSGGAGVSLPAFAQSLLYIDCWGNNFRELPALPPNLQYLICNNCTWLERLPALPVSLQYLNVNSCGSLDSLPVLPENLEYLSATYSRVYMSALPNKLRYLNLYFAERFNSNFHTLPDSLRYFNISLHYGAVTLTSLPPFLDTLIGSAATFFDLPSLPATLKYLDCEGNELTSLPSLPEGLLYLNCGINRLHTIPDFPNSLKEINCSYNPLHSLPSLPPGLIKLVCGSDSLTALPPLPSTLLSLDCSSTPGSNGWNGYNANRITSLPALPNTLQYLDCSYNPLYSIADFPDSAKTIICKADSLSALPALPPYLTKLDCSHNVITALPALNGSLKNLYCNNNKLQTWPSIPGKPIEIFAQQNDIYCLPALPAIYATLPRDWLTVKVDAHKIVCVPNIPPGVFIERYDSSGNRVYALPLCNPLNNANDCDAFPVMTGTAFYDNNSNGTKDPGELPKAYVKVALSEDNFTFTDENGYYEIGTTGTGNFTLTAEGTPLYFDMVPPFYQYTFTSNDTIVTNNFALTPNAVVDSINFYVSGSNRSRPGFTMLYFFNYQNAGTTTLNSQIVFDYDSSRLIYNESDNAAVVNSGHSLSAVIGNLAPGQQGSFYASFTIKTSAVLGDSLFATANLKAGINQYTSNTASVISGSFDPNDKQATPQLSPLQVAAGNDIDYTIRFQNTGTDTAFTVVISDTLTEDLQANTFQMIASSHNCKTTLKDNIVFFEFRNILLPDSNVNELKSHGFVSFRIKPKTTVAANTVIPNKAAIYFDYNAPVITNTAGTLIKDFTVVPLKLISFGAVPQNDNTTSLYWNTANEINTKHFAVERGVDGLHYNFIATVFAKGKANNHYNAVVTDANTGIVFYRLKIVDTDGSFTYSPVIKIDKRKNTTGIHILSNPVKDVIVISTTDRTMHNTQASIINMQGAVVKTFILKEGSQAIEIRDLPGGIYYLRTVNGSRKIVVQ